MENKLDVELKVRDGTRRLLNAYKGNRVQLLEAAKSLHTSNERISAYTNELQQRKQRSFNTGSADAKVTQIKMDR
jgi:hypothetical protein